MTFLLLILKQADRNLVRNKSKNHITGHYLALDCEHLRAHLLVEARRRPCLTPTFLLSSFHTVRRKPPALKINVNLCDQKRLEGH